MELFYIEMLESELQKLYNRLDHCDKEERQKVQRNIQRFNLNLSRICPCE